MAQDLDGSQEGRGGGAGRDLKTIGDCYEQLHANKFGKLSERDNLADVKSQNQFRKRWNIRINQ